MCLSSSSVLKLSFALLNAKILKKHTKIENIPTILKKNAIFALQKLKNKHNNIMTELTVSIEDVSMLEQIKQAISMLKGVSSVTIKRKAKTGMERAIEDIKEGRVYEASSVEDLINQCKA